MMPKLQFLFGKRHYLALRYFCFTLRQPTTDLVCHMAMDLEL